MKHISIISLGLTFAGSFLGAGYVSGQEIWQFFGSYGINGVLGLTLAMILQCVFGIILIRLTQDTGIDDFEKIVIRWEIPFLRIFFGAAEVFFLFGICVIMYAGAGALLKQSLSIPSAIGSLLLCAVVAIISMRGLKGMVSVFSLLVPPLVVFTLLFSGFSVSKFGFFDFIAADSSNPLLGNWVFSAINFVSYNLFCSIGILTPLAKHIQSKRSVVLGTALGCSLLFIIAIAIILALCSYPISIYAELPMLALAETLSPSGGKIYALLMLLSMYGTALSCHVATVEYLGQKFSPSARSKTLIALALILFGWLGSLVGFGSLIGVIYPLCGYFGLGALICLLAHYIYIHRQRTDS